MQLLYFSLVNTHQQYMQRCLDLAIKGLGNVAPNPMVGCVIVHEDKIIGEGCHEKYGEAHAEVNAIRKAEETNAELLPESNLYVNLEPCSHHGKTPPCVDLILSKKIPRVVIGSYDPNPLVAGKGIQKLKEAGVEVITEVLKKESDFLNRRFLTFHTQQRPYVILKWAESADGFMAPLDNKQVWLTNDSSKKLVHRWRSEEMAVMVGKNTVLADDPQLTARLWEGKNPLRVVIDKNLELKNGLKVFDMEASALVFNTIENSRQKNIERVKLGFSANVEQQILKSLYDRSIASVIIEGGAALLNSFLERGLWDEARTFYTQHLIGNGKKVISVKGQVLEDINIEGDNLKVFLRQ